MDNLRIGHGKFSFVQKIQQKHKKRNKTPLAFVLHFNFFVPCRELLTYPVKFLRSGSCLFLLYPLCFYTVHTLYP